MRAISGLWAMCIGLLGAYQVFFVDPAKQLYYGGQYSYWLIHDVTIKFYICNILIVIDVRELACVCMLFYCCCGVDQASIDVALARGFCQQCCLAFIFVILSQFRWK